MIALRNEGVRHILQRIITAAGHAAAGAPHSRNGFIGGRSLVLQLSATRAEAGDIRAVLSVLEIPSWVHELEPAVRETMRAGGVPAELTEVVVRLFWPAAIETAVAIFVGDLDHMRARRCRRFQAN